MLSVRAMPRFSNHSSRRGPRRPSGVTAPSWRQLADQEENYQSNAGEKPFMRKWILRALAISILIHLALLAYFYSTKLEHFNVTEGERLVPSRAFNVVRANINPKLFDSSPEQKAEMQKPKPPQPIAIPDEPKPFQKLMGEVRMTPQATEPVQPILNDKPHVNSTKLQSLEKTQTELPPSVNNDLELLQSKTLKGQPQISTSLNKLANSANASSNPTSGDSGISKQIDKMLNNYGSLKGSAQGLTMPGDTFFDFGSAEINPSVIDALRKLGQLIERDPRTHIDIEGYSDSFGTDAYDKALSLERANAVRDWLIKNMGLKPSQITTRGMGKSHFIVPPKPVDMSSQSTIDAEIARQQKNRRVEIVIHFPK